MRDGSSWSAAKRLRRLSILTVSPQNANLRLRFVVVTRRKPSNSNSSFAQLPMAVTEEQLVRLTADGGDRTSMLFRVPEALVNIAHFQKINELAAVREIIH
jgi:hypothetical protein